jgi:CxxC motif-containing protein
MTGVGKGKVVDRGGKYSKTFIYIPKEVASDTSFPFKKGEDVTVRIEGKKLIIEKLENTEKKEINRAC